MTFVDSSEKYTFGIMLTTQDTKENWQNKLAFFLAPWQTLNARFTPKNATALLLFAPSDWKAFRQSAVLSF